MIVRLTSQLLNQLQKEAAKAAPQESCGMLLGEGAVITAIEPARNIHPQPETHFEIDPKALITAHKDARQTGPKLLGYYHSHPRSAAKPSAEDARRANQDGTIWAIIGGDGAVTFWRDGEKGFTPVPYSLLEE